MIYLLCALHFRWLVWELLIYRKAEVKPAPFVHALVRFYREDEVEDIVGIGKLSLPGTARL